jgi:hypothetical protein
MAMVNMKSKPYAEEPEEAETMEGDEPRYPYGLCLHLGNDEIEKLKLTQVPDIGTEVMIMAKAFVKSTSAYETQSEGKSRSVELQITDLELGPVQQKPDAATVMYGKE